MRKLSWKLWSRRATFVHGGDIVTYNDADWITSESGVANEDLMRLVGELFKRQVGEEVARKFKISATSKGVAIDNAVGD